MNQKAIEQANDKDLPNSLIAMRRAAKRARQVAAQTGTCLIVRHGEQIDRVAVTGKDNAAAKDDIG
jgi:hypothetical protein